MKKYRCTVCDYIYDLQSVIRTAASPPAPLSKICPTIGAARFAA